MGEAEFDKIGARTPSDQSVAGEDPEEGERSQSEEGEDEEEEDEEADLLN